MLGSFTRTNLPIAVCAVLIASTGWLQAQYSPPTNGLVAWWSAEGNANDNIAGHNGTASLVTFVPGVFGQSFEFNAPSSGNCRVNVPDDPAFALTNSLTLGAWVRQAVPSWTILMRGDSRPGFDPYSLSVNPGTGLLLFQIEDPQDNVITLVSPAPFPTNQWVQVTGTLDDATGDMRLYENGVLVAETNTTIRPLGALIPAYAPSLAIGNTPVYNFPWVGDIDEVVIYSRALTPTEVSGLATGPAPQVSIGTHPFVSVTGLVGATYAVQYTTAVPPTNSWTTLTNLTLTATNQEWTDFSVDAARDPQRFYRAVLVALP